MTNGIDAVIEDTKRLFYYVTGYAPVRVRVEVARDIYRRCVELAHSEAEKKRYEQSAHTLAGLKGTIVWPARLKEEPTVLIDAKTFGKEENGIFYSTLTHELTHVHDFYAFAEHFGYHDPDAVQKDKHFTVFYFWTEFHARRVGYTIYRALMLGAFPQSRAKQLGHILNEEGPFQLGILNDGLKEYIQKKEPLLYMYSLVQYLARFSVWSDLSPYITMNGLPKEVTGAFGRKAADLYEYLHMHREFDSFIASFSELEGLINAFTADFNKKKILDIP